MPRSTLIASLVCLAIATNAASGAVARHPTKVQPRNVPVDDLGRPPRPNLPGPFRFADAALEPLAWGDLDGWAQDNHAEAFATFRASCRAVVGHARWGD